MPDPATDPLISSHDELLAELYLYVNWRYVTKQLTRAQKEMWADAVDRHMTGPVDRWWRDA